MFGILFRTEVKPHKRQDFIEHAKWVVEVAQNEEPTALRFDFYTDPNNEDVFYVFEAYEDEAGFDAHKQNESYRRWASGRRQELTSNVEVILLGGQTVATTAE